MERCDECGYAYEDHGAVRLAEDLRALGPRYAGRLGATAGSATLVTLRERPEPGVWSALEYACHVRDVLLAQRERLLVALVEECPSFAPIYREQRVVLARYGDADPGRVAVQLDMAAMMVADAFERLDGNAWGRECIYNFPAPARRSVAWLGAHTLHEGEHHLADVDRVMALVAARGGVGAGSPLIDHDAVARVDGAQIAATPPPPYLAVVFTSIRSPGDDDGYAEAAAAMAALARTQPGYLGLESAREHIGITVSYWSDEIAASAWKRVAEHLVAQRRGLQSWYVDYRVRVATVERDYGPADSELRSAPE
jgi:heme-degrading monooxygenase HmoA